MLENIVCKFGGTSLADAAQIERAISIFLMDSVRRCMVVSAPGKRHRGDDKVTDLLYAWHAGRHDTAKVEQIHQKLLERFVGIANGLKTSAGAKVSSFVDVPGILAQYRQMLDTWQEPDYIASRGEYLNAKLIAAAMGALFVPADFIRFDARGKLDMPATARQALHSLDGDALNVIPGFYGRMPDGSVRTFSRGGSDLTGAIVAAVTDADLYENWTDVDGIRMAHPGIVPDAKKIDVITFREIRELSYNGADVLHEEVVYPLYKKGIPIQVRNTNDVSQPGSLVVSDADAPERRSGTIVGVAGKRDFTVIRLEKMLMNAEVGFIERVTRVFSHYGVSIECIPGGLDSICVTVASSAVKKHLDAILLDLEEECRPDVLKVIPELALVCTVGNAMDHAKGVAAKLFRAVSDAGVNVSTIVQCASEKSIIIGVENADCEKAIAAIYRAFA